mmetsp:Transcript_57305/g.170878  ORF Transcript_57305/g.170878 Transcript_57305/m.170878 type:complete len:84 (+) Transcript_57305:543-794(+)
MYIHSSNANSDCSSLLVVLRRCRRETRNGSKSCTTDDIAVTRGDGSSRLVCITTRNSNTWQQTLKQSNVIVVASNSGSCPTAI